MKGDRELTVFTDIAELLTLSGAHAKDARHVTDADLSIVADAVLVCAQGRVVWVGRRSDWITLGQMKFTSNACHEISLHGAVVTPAFVEPHTHLLFAGDRAQEWEWRIQGQTYRQIAARGGGILSTVAQTRAASDEELRREGQLRVNRFLRQGVTTIESKSGYGLDLKTEVRLLKTARTLTGARVISTYLGAHSRSPDFADLDSYVEFMCQKVLPELAREKLCERVDIYVESGFFTVAQGRQYLRRAQELGFQLTAHVEQLSDSGGATMALEFAPQSLDHLVFIGGDALTRLAQSATTAVLLPTSDFYLRMKYPPARTLIETGARVALSSDFNPGTSPTQDLSLVGVLARLEMRMSWAEVLVAYTLGGAHALGLGHELGSLTEGKYCDFVVLEGSWRELFYSVGRHPVARVFKMGKEISGVNS